jgi:leader peptidase (prepilin peptidase)/N-methyltransferase
LRHRAGLGLGDAKLFAAAGAWLGPAGLPSVLVWACGAALIAVAIHSIRGQTLSRTSRIAFGPFLAFGFWIVWLFGPFA